MPVASAPVKAFDAPDASLGRIDAAAAATVIAAASDVALILDRDGIIRDLAFGIEVLAREDYTHWLGRPWAETVTADSRSKVELLLREAGTHTASRTRQVNHRLAAGVHLPVSYTAFQVGSEGRVVAVGRDSRSIASLQQRLVEAQQAMERDYWRLRNVETRYRLLFQTASEAVLIVDAATGIIAEANPAAVQRIGATDRPLPGRALTELFDQPGAAVVQVMLASVRVAGRADDVRVRLTGLSQQVTVSASWFRHERGSNFLVRVSDVSTDAAITALPHSKATLLAAMVERAPDAMVVTQPDGRVLAANAAFVELAQVATEEQARGESIERWLGRRGIDLNVMLSNVQQHGAVRLFATTLRGEAGAATDVEISAVAVEQAGEPSIGFTIRDVGRRLHGDARAGRDLPRSVDQLTELVGRVPLKELVREATDLIERLCIESALELTHNNRVSAAKLLGLSRQSLYVKLRRYAVGDRADSDT